MRIPRLNPAALGAILVLAAGLPASAGATLALEDFNRTTIGFTAKSGDPTVADTTYNVSGGNIVPSTLDGHPLAYLYCIQYATDIYVAGTYGETAITRDGTVDNGKPVNHANQVAYLLTQYASQAVTPDQQAGLQAAIWNEVSPFGITLSPSTAASPIGAYYNQYLTNLKSASTDQVLWLSPSQDGTTYFQALITPVPEPSTLYACLVSLVAGGATWGLRRRKLARA